MWAYSFEDAARLLGIIKSRAQQLTQAAERFDAAAVRPFRLIGFILERSLGLNPRVPITSGN